MTSPDATFQAGVPIRSSKSTASTENGELEKNQARFFRVVSQSFPLGLGEFHASPVVETSLVLTTELYSPWFVNRAFGIRDVRLEFNRVRTHSSYRVNEGVGRPEASVVGLRHFRDDKARMSDPYRVLPNVE